MADLKCYGVRLVCGIQLNVNSRRHECKQSGRCIFAPSPPDAPKVHCHACPATPEEHCERNCLDVIAAEPSGVAPAARPNLWKPVVQPKALGGKDGVAMVQGAPGAEWVRWSDVAHLFAGSDWTPDTVPLGERAAEAIAEMRADSVKACGCGQPPGTCSSCSGSRSGGAGASNECLYPAMCSQPKGKLCAACTRGVRAGDPQQAWKEGVACIRSVTTQCTYPNCSCTSGVKGLDDAQG